MAWSEVGFLVGLVYTGGAIDARQEVLAPALIELTNMGIPGFDEPQQAAKKGVGFRSRFLSTPPEEVELRMTSFAQVSQFLSG